MNICFTLREGNGDKTEKSFLSGAAEKGLLGLKGHRSVGGMRASNYNSVSLEGAEQLVAYLERFAKA